jgi:hypothetical protein
MLGSWRAAGVGRETLDAICNSSGGDLQREAPYADKVYLQFTRQHPSASVPGVRIFCDP